MTTTKKLIADVGGTHARFALFDDRKTLIGATTFAVKDYPSLYVALRAYIDQQRVDLDAACFAVAGPVIHGEVSFSNSPWVCNQEKLRSILGLRDVYLINDFEAQAFGIGVLDKNTVDQIMEGQIDTNFPGLVVGAGTGLGMAHFIDNHGQITVTVTEGGHASLPVQNDEEMALLKYLQQSLGRSFIRVEDVLSGIGLERLYAYYSPSDKGRSASELLEMYYQNDVNVLYCVEVFTRFLARVIRNSILASGARGQVYLSGGMIARLSPQFPARTFRETFELEASPSAFMSNIPIFLIKDHDLGLKGAMAFLLQHLRK